MGTLAAEKICFILKTETWQSRVCNRKIKIKQFLICKILKED